MGYGAKHHGNDHQFPGDRFRSDKLSTPYPPCQKNQKKKTTRTSWKFKKDYPSAPVVAWNKTAQTAFQKRIGMKKLLERPQDDWKQNYANLLMTPKKKELPEWSQNK